MLMQFDCCCSGAWCWKFCCWSASPLVLFSSICYLSPIPSGKSFLASIFFNHDFCFLCKICVCFSIAFMQPLATCMHSLQVSKMALGLQISEPWLREYQVSALLSTLAMRKLDLKLLFLSYGMVFLTNAHITKDYFTSYV